MIFFDIGETVVCTILAKQAGVEKDPDSLQITIYDPDGEKDVTNVGMDRDTDGHWHYDYATAGKAKGFYRAEVKGTYGSRIILVNGGFKLR